MTTLTTYPCIRCEAPVEVKGFRCEPCRVAHAAYQKKYDKLKKISLEDCIKPSKYRGKRPCNVCEQTFMSHDKRSNHTCEPCRDKQLRMCDEWAGG